VEVIASGAAKDNNGSFSEGMTQFSLHPNLGVLAQCGGELLAKWSGKGA
jgi:hypothetical protein